MKVLLLSTLSLFLFIQDDDLKETVQSLIEELEEEYNGIVARLQDW